MAEIEIEKIISVKEIEKLFTQPDNYKDIMIDIDTRGIQEPLIITPKNELVCGYTRLAIAKQLKLKTVPCRQVEFKNRGSLAQYAFCDNVKRRHLSDLEIVESFLELEKLFNKRQGKKVDILSTSKKGKTRDLVAKEIYDLTGILMSGRRFERLKIIALKAIPALKYAYIKGNCTQKEVLKICRNEPLEVQQRIIKMWLTTPAELKKEEREAERKELESYFNDHPKLIKWQEALLNEELSRTQLNSNHLQADTHKKEFTGQPHHYPKFSGVEVKEQDDWTKSIDHIPLFSLEEWKEWNNRNYKGELEYWRKIGIWLRDDDYEKGRKTILRRRTYDPNYGNFIAENESGEKWDCEVCRGKMYVKQGWGKWMIAKFNDGEGKRIKRRFFQHDHLGHTLIELAKDTADSRLFSSADYYNLDIHQVQKTKISWFYWKKETRDINKAIEMLKKDIKRLEKKKTEPEKELNKRELKFLADYVIKGIFARDSFREGEQSYKRLPDGKIDRKYMELKLK